MYNIIKIENALEFVLKDRGQGAVFPPVRVEFIIGLSGYNFERAKINETTRGISRWSPIQVLTTLDVAY